MDDVEEVYKNIVSCRTKICPECDRELDLDKFYKDKAKPSGRKTVCIDCYLDDKAKRYYQKKEANKPENKKLEEKMKHIAKKSHPKIGRFYRLENGDIVKVIYFRMGKYPFWVVDVRPIIPVTDVTQYTLAIWEFRRNWIQVKNPKLKETPTYIKPSV